MKNITLSLLTAFTLIGCNSNKNNFDASGTFEAIETIISADANGTINQFDLQEGQILSKGQFIGYIDSTQLYLKKVQLQKQVGALLSKKPNISIQLAILNVQLNTAIREKNRTSNLFQAGAATKKQLDDRNADIEVIKNQIQAPKINIIDY